MTINKLVTFIVVLSSILACNHKNEISFVESEDFAFIDTMRINNENLVQRSDNVIVKARDYSNSQLKKSIGLYAVALMDSLYSVKKYEHLSVRFFWLQKL